MTTPMEHKRHKLLSEVADHVTETGVDYGLSSEQAEQLGLAVADFSGISLWRAKLHLSS